MMVAAERKATFKKHVSQEDSRRSRNDTTLQLRKTRKEEQLAKRRQMATHKSSDKTDGTSNNTISQITNQADILNKVSEILNVYKQMADPANVVSTEQVLQATTDLRKLMSADKPPVQAVVEAGVLTYLSGFLAEEFDHMANLQFEAAWALTNIASTKYTPQVAMTEGAVINMVRLLGNSDFPNVREQCIWCVGNIAGESVEFRDAMLNTEGLIWGLIRNLTVAASVSLLGNCAWAVSNHCRGKPSPDEKLISPFILPLVEVLRICQETPLEEDTTNVVSDTIWAISYLLDGSSYVLQQTLDAGVLPLLFNAMDRHWDNKAIMVPTVRSLGNIVTGDDQQTQKVVDAGILKYAVNLLGYPSSNIVKETCWLLSNIAAGTKDQIHALIMASGEGYAHAVITKVISLAIDSKFEIRKEALWTICNVITNGKNGHIDLMMSYNAMVALCDALKALSDIKVLKIVLEAFAKILSMDQHGDYNYKLLMDEFGGIDHLEELQSHPDDEIYQMASDLLTKYFDTVDEEDQNIVPVESENSNTFQFGISKQLFPPSSNTSAQPMFNFSSSGAFNTAV